MVRVGGGVHDSYTFQCGLVGYFTSPGIDTGKEGPTAFSISSERHLVPTADRGHFLVVTPPHRRTSYNLFFLEGGCIGSWKRMVVSLSSL